MGLVSAVARHPSGRIGGTIILAFLIIAGLGAVGLTPHDPLKQFVVDRLKPKMASMIVRPGNTISHGARVIIDLLSASITPSDGAGGWVPRPRKLRPDSVSNAQASARVICTVSGATRLSSRCRVRI